jgi:quinol monooxygenase YgiN
MSQVVVVATITARAGAEAALAELLSAQVGPTRLEAGCLRYDLHRDPTQLATLVFLENWESKEALKAHMSTPRFLAARDRQADMVAARDIKVLEQI